MYQLRLTDLLICCICSTFVLPSRKSCAASGLSASWAVQLQVSLEGFKCCAWPSCSTAVESSCWTQRPRWAKYILGQAPKKSKIAVISMQISNVDYKMYWTICHYPDPYVSVYQLVSNNVLSGFGMFWMGTFKHMQRSVTVCGTRVSSQKSLSNIPLQRCRMMLCCNNFCMFLPSFASDLETVPYLFTQVSLRSLRSAFRWCGSHSAAPAAVSPPPCTISSPSRYQVSEQCWHLN